MAKFRQIWSHCSIHPPRTVDSKCTDVRVVAKETAGTAALVIERQKGNDTKTRGRQGSINRIERERERERERKKENNRDIFRDKT